MIFDYAKVRAVVEDRRSMLSAIGAAAGFIRRNAGAAVMLFLLNFGAFALTIGVYALVAPGAGRAGLMMWLGLASRAGLCDHQALDQADVLGVGDGAVPGPPRSRRIRRARGAGLARVARSRRHLNLRIRNS